MKKLISFVIPCYRSEGMLPGVVGEIKETMERLEDYDYEVVLVNDCSPDHTFAGRTPGSQGWIWPGISDSTAL